ncbi:hypothetical protein [Terrilactibacillus laevilacticus]|uniref:Uncharacterized protein n=1 Tax=Terrilactibacillus laevilacticus TaxID=1380157 RepID=A0ABW5PT52_9BACI|nr:hypothetical protein [Terrilactibacillus laevilacticus]
MGLIKKLFARNEHQSCCDVKIVEVKDDQSTACCKDKEVKGEVHSCCSK